MKKFLIAIVVFMFSLTGQAQFIHATVKKNANPCKIDVVFKSDYNSAPGEYIIYLQISLSIPVGVSGGVTATAVGTGIFANMGILVPVPPTTKGTEQVYSFIFAIPNPAIQSWTNGVSFVGTQVTFSNAAAAATVKLLDLTNIGGGNSTNVYYAINSSIADVTPYGDFFFAIPGQSFIDTYPSGDQFVQTIKAASLLFLSTTSDITDKGGNSTTDETVNQMEVLVYPNPSDIGFNLKLTTSGNEDVMIRVLDISGKVIQVLKGTPDQLFHLGDQLLPGTYIAEVRQGTERTMVKLVKLQ